MSTEADRERVIDARVQRRLSTDAAYRNAENAEQQAEREDEITRQECERFTFARATDRLAHDLDKIYTVLP